jgi:ACR3 family arsenite efflux pump ArsB
MARVYPVARVLPAVAVGLGLGHAAVLGGLTTPVAFTRAVLAVGVLCPLMMGQSSTSIGRVMLRPQARLLPLLVSLALGPALALALGRCLLQHHPEQALALLLLSLLPGSALAPVWAAGTRASGSTAVGLTLIGWLIAALVGLPLVAGPLAPGAGLTVFRDLALLGVAPLALGSVLRAVLVDTFDPEQYAASVEPARQTVVQASLAVLLFTLMASDEVATVIRGASASLPAFAAVALLYLGLFVGCGVGLLAFRRRLSRATARATLQVTTTRQTVLAMSLLPFAVVPSALGSAFAVPLFGLVIELLFGTAALAFHGSGANTLLQREAADRDGCPSIVPE